MVSMAGLVPADILLNQKSTVLSKVNLDSAKKDRAEEIRQARDGGVPAQTGPRAPV